MPGESLDQRFERAVAFLEKQAMPFERTPAGVVLRADALEGLSLTFIQG